MACNRTTDGRFAAIASAAISPEERFWSKVDKNYPGDCWLWTGCLCKGYGHFWFEDRLVYAHVFAYELENGPVPDGLELDHKCRMKPCVRSVHLEAVTHQVNIIRGYAERTHCKRGHPLSGENCGRQGQNWRFCRTCKRRSYQLCKERLNEA